MKFKRWLPASLILMLLIGCMTYTVFAAEDDYIPIAPKVDYMPDPRQPDTYVPPVYFGDGSETPEPEIYHETIEDAAAELRGLLEKRETSIVIGFQTASSDYDKRLEVFYEALEHTGVPTQGDYLAYQHGVFSYGIDGYFCDGVYYITFTYDMTYYTTAEQEAQVDAAVENLLNTLDLDECTDFEKISGIYDYITKNVVYDYDGLTLENQTNNNKKIYTAYGALIDGTSVCQGYANLFYRLALELDVDNRIIAGLGDGGPHAWNIVQLDNLYYDVDATWDATNQQTGQVYNYFLRCEDNFEKHTRDAKFLTADFNAEYPMSESDYYYIIDSGTYGETITWEFGSDYQLSISGTGIIDSDPWSNYFYKVESIVIDKGITGIGEQVFGSFYALHTVEIPDSVQTIDFAAFYACNNLQTVIYGGTQNKWNQIAIDIYNANLTDATILYIGEIKLAAAAPILYDNIAMNYKLNKTKFDSLGITNPYIVVTFNGQQTTIKNYTVNEDGTRYIFTFYNIAPNKINDTMTAVVYATYNGTEYTGKSKDYSVAEYCYDQLEDYSDDIHAKFRTLLVDLLNYGAVSQQYTEYKTNNLANAKLTDIQRNWATKPDGNYKNIQNAKYTVIDNPTVRWKGAGLVLRESVVIRLKFEAESLEGLSFRFESGGKTWTVTKTSVENGGNYVYFRGLNAAQMSDEVFATAYQNGVAVSNTARYSIETYASQSINDTETPYLSQLVDAMMKYGIAAKAYITP